MDKNNENIYLFTIVGLMFAIGGTIFAAFDFIINSLSQHKVIGIGVSILIFILASISIIISRKLYSKNKLLSLVALSFSVPVFLISAYFISKGIRSDSITPPIIRSVESYEQMTPEQYVLHIQPCINSLKSVIEDKEKNIGNIKAESLPDYLKEIESLKYQHRTIDDFIIDLNGFIKEKEKYPNSDLDLDQKKRSSIDQITTIINEYRIEFCK